MFQAYMFSFNLGFFLAGAVLGGLTPCLVYLFRNNKIMAIASPLICGALSFVHPIASLIGGAVLLIPPLVIWINKKLREKNGTNKKSSKSKTGASKSKQPASAKAKRSATATAKQTAPTLTVENYNQNSRLNIFYLALAFSVPFLIMLLIFAISGATPFGKSQIHATDLWHQYYPFMVDYQDKLQEGGSLLWTWKSGGGTNFIALMSYYLASPLNFLSVLIPTNWLNGFLTISTCLKIGFAGLFFAMFLKITFKRSDLSISAFGTLYALCAFIMGYYWNVIWLDTIALLPLVIAGAIALLKEGKWKLYVLSLGLSILANYYIGLFTCIFVALCAIAYSIIEYKGWKNLLINFAKMVGCSLLGVAMSAVLTIPAYLALQNTQSSNNTFPEFSVNMGLTPDFQGILQGIGKTIGNSIAFLQPTEREGLPNVYSGVIVIFLAILFFLCSKIKLRERIICGVGLLFFTLSFIIRPLDYLWHGMHFPNMLPHRFSFLYTFVIIYMAYRVFMYIDEIKPAPVIAAICGFAAYLVIASVNIDLTKASQNPTNHTLVRLSPIFSDSGVNPVLMSAVIGGILALWVLLYSLRNVIPNIALISLAGVIGAATAIFVFANGKVFNSAISKDGKNGFYIFLGILILLITAGAVLLLSSKSLNRDHRMTKTVLSVILLLLAVTEGFFSAASGVKTNGVTDTTTYPLGKYDTLACVDKAKSLENGIVDLPRTEVDRYHTLNDNALIGADGISMFNSMTNKDVTAYMEKFGICGWIAANRYTYQESSPLTNLMLNLKYIISPRGQYLDSVHNELAFQSNNVKLMRVKNYISQGFMVKKALLKFDVATAPLHPMANQNRMFNLATGLSGNVYEFLDYTPSEAQESVATVKSNMDGSTYSYSSPNSSDSYDINFTVPRDGVATAYFSAYYTDNCTIRVNGIDRNSCYTKRPYIMMVGDVKAGDVVTLHFDIKNSSSGSVTAHCAMFNDDLFTKGCNLLKLSTFKADKVTDTELEGTINAKEDGLFYTSISYDPGWKAYVDGVETEITPVGGAELAFPLSAGTHRIELRYVPKGFVLGSILTILSIMIFVALIFIIPRRKTILEKIRSVFKSEKPQAVTETYEKEKI